MSYVLKAQELTAKEPSVISREKRLRRRVYTQNFVPRHMMPS